MITTSTGWSTRFARYREHGNETGERLVPFRKSCTLPSGARASRKPLLVVVLRFIGWLLVRFAIRQFAASSSQLPPRFTRFEPVPEATGSVRFSRKVVGWSISESLSTPLVSVALRRAIESRCPVPGELLHNSDRGCQYTSHEYQKTLQTFGIACSMSRRGCCYDNAVME